MIDISRELALVRTSKMKGAQFFYRALKKIADGVNQFAVNVGADTVTTNPPTDIAGINVKAASGVVHVVLSDPSNVVKNTNYFVEADTNSAFTQPHVFHINAARETFLTLPGKTDGGATQNFYFRGYSQKPGSPPSNPVVFGGTTNPTAVPPGGSVQLTPLASTGSGTASNNGNEGGAGIGKTLYRTL